MPLRKDGLRLCRTISCRFGRKHQKSFLSGMHCEWVEILAHRTKIMFDRLKLHMYIKPQIREQEMEYKPQVAIIEDHHLSEERVFTTDTLNNDKMEKFVSCSMS